jgi:pimeloyl-ACP methyl ester carboxylesterase
VSALWIGLGVGLGLASVGGLLVALLVAWLYRKYVANVVRIFQEKPLFIVPRGEPMPGAEEVRFPSSDGLTLQGCYLRATLSRRRGVILFGLEFGSNRWACVPYTDFLVANGFDVFTFEPRNQGDSDGLLGYDPLQWVTNHEVTDTRSALAYLKGRADADPVGVGFFGISKGAGAGLLAAARDPYVRCAVTDGVFATYTTMVPYMQKWIAIYSDRHLLQLLLPTWVYGLVGRLALRRISRERGCRFPHLERAIAKLAPRPLLMIHGGADTYIKPEMGQALFDLAGVPKEFWLVEGAKHNQALNVAGEEYRRRVLAFFREHLNDATELVAKPALAPASA